MSLATNLSNFATRVSTEVKSLRTLINGNAADNTALTTTAKGNLVLAINEVNAKPAGVNTLDGLTDVVITATSTGHVLRHDGTNFVNVLGTTHFQAADSDLAAIAALTTTSFGRDFLALADSAALTLLVSAASETLAGKVEISTAAENTTGTDNTRAVSPLGLQTRMAEYAQPLDSDLTAIAALTTTTYGRALLALVDQAGLMALLADASTTVAGKVALATNAEAQTGTDTAKATTAAGTKAAIDQRIINDSTLAGNSTINAPSVASVKAYADGLLDASNGITFKGAIDASTNPNYPAASAGHQYKISVAGKIGGAAGPNVEVNDTLYCTVDATAAGTQAAVGANWVITQSNLDGAVIGPASAVSGDLATFSGTTGKVVADSGLSVSSAAIGAGSTTVVPTTSAVVAFAQPKEATLTGLAATAPTADQLIYATGADAFSTTALTVFARTLLDDIDAATARGTLSVYSQAEIGNPEQDLVAVFNAGLV